MTVDNLRVHPWGAGWWGWHGSVRHDRWWTGGPVGDQGFCAHHWLLGVATHPWGLHRLCAMQWITWKGDNIWIFAPKIHKKVKKRNLTRRWIPRILGPIAYALWRIGLKLFNDAFLVIGTIGVPIFAFVSVSAFLAIGTRLLSWNFGFLSKKLLQGGSIAP